MTTATAEPRCSPVQRQLAAYEHSATLDRAKENAPQDSEETIAVGISVFHLLKARIDSWRDRVFRGTQEYSQDDERSLQQQLGEWLQVTERVLKDRSPSEAAPELAEDAARLRSCAEAARQTLSSWVSPRLSRAVGLREMDLSPEAAAELDRALEEAKLHPPSLLRSRMNVYG